MWPQARWSNGRGPVVATRGRHVVVAAKRREDPFGLARQRQQSVAERFDHGDGAHRPMLGGRDLARLRVPLALDVDGFGARREVQIGPLERVQLARLHGGVVCAQLAGIDTGEQIRPLAVKALKDITASAVVRDSPARFGCIATHVAAPLAGLQGLAQQSLGRRATHKPLHKLHVGAQAGQWRRGDELREVVEGEALARVRVDPVAPGFFSQHALQRRGHGRQPFFAAKP
jgi:hypothetical protein